jgi:2,4-dienoyl-CoA reductase-like NADH-dependent reductase (Old Yellow Enzyme family)
MGSADNIETFTYVATQLNAMNIAWLHVMDGLGFGFHAKTRPMKLIDFKKVFDGPVIGNVGYTRDTAEGVIRSGAAEFIAFGRPYISNPDLVQRFTNDWPLAPENPAIWFTHDEVGYADFPNYSA